MTNILEVRGAIRRFPASDGGEVTVLDGIDLDVPQGELLAIVGPSGCGKSTLLNAILGFDQLSAGEIRILGQPVGRPDRRRICVFQQPTLFPYLSVLDNVTYGPWHVQRPWLHLLATSELPLLSRIGIGRGWLRKRMPILSGEWELQEGYTKRAKELLELVGLGHALNKYPHELSGGMRQRAQIAQSLIMEPEVLLMDEPFSALDEGTKIDLHRLVLQIHQTVEIGRQPWLHRASDVRRMTIILVTHHLDEAIYLSSRLIALCRSPAKVVVDVKTPVYRYDEPAELERFGKLREAIFRSVYDPRAKGRPAPDEVERIEALAEETRRGRESLP
jgi:NitT/TauT family transport system ATP-binding protein